MVCEEMANGKVAGRTECGHGLKALRAGGTLVMWRLDRLGRNPTLGLEKLMAIEVPMPPLIAQQTFNGMQTEVGALKAKHATNRQANAALMPATLERVFPGSQ